MKTSAGPRLDEAQPPPRRGNGSPKVPGMAGHPSTAPRSANALLVRIIGVVLAMSLGIAVAGLAPQAPGNADGKRADDIARANLEAARGRAIDWATPECRDRIRKAVKRVSTERAVEDAAWAACPDHPDVYD